MDNRGRGVLHRYARITAGATWLLLIAGALVTSTDSGLAVPDWPLSYGMWFPPMVGGILYEHGHRMIAAIVGLLILALAVWLWKAEPRRWVRALGYSALAAVVVQGLLGGLTVLLLLPPHVSIAHACLGQLVFVLVVCIAHGSSPVRLEGRMPDDRHIPGWLAILGVVLALLVVLQVGLGAVVRHTGSALPFHAATAIALLVAAGWMGWWVSRQRCDGVVKASVWRLFALLCVQGLLGAALLASRGVWLRTSHVALGALVVAQAVLLAWEANRAVGRRSWPASSRLSGMLQAYVELTKPRLTWLVLVTTAAGFWLGIRASEPWHVLVPTLLGTALVVGGANALNQWMERIPDALMRRTQGRPLPSGRLTPEQAQGFGWILVVGGVVWLASAVNVLTGLLAALSAGLYVWVYTPLKRTTALCTLAGAVPGAIPPMIGWAAARNALDPGAWALFALLFVWQLPHFLAIALVYREDYARAGFRMLPVTERAEGATARQIALYGLALLPVSLVPARMGLAGAWYFFGALALGIGFLVLAGWTAWARSAQSARQLFLGSVLYLPLLLGLMVCDRTWR
ncbi:MAG: heme o synthase [Candidatus Omnitrophota bacterium]|nr:heme o synthase [Candidatus Omnitrophota bacterium]